MKSLLLLTILFYPVQSYAYHSSWTSTDKFVFGVESTLIIVDGYQTLQIKDYSGANEIGLYRFIDYNDQNNIVLASVVGIGATYLIMDFIPSTRKYIPFLIIYHAQIIRNNHVFLAHIRKEF